MTIECPHERVEFHSGGKVTCMQCGKVSQIGDGLCARCHRPLNDKPHQGAMPCAAGSLR